MKTAAVVSTSSELDSTSALLYTRDKMPSQKTRLFKDIKAGTLLETGRCPLCNTSNAQFWRVLWAGTETYKGWCPACTNVNITPAAIDEAKSQNKAHLVSAFLRRLPAEDFTNAGFIGEGSLDSVFSQVRQPDAIEQYDLALTEICRMCPEPGLTSTFNFEVDWPLIVARSQASVSMIIVELVNSGYLDSKVSGSAYPPRPTWKAYQRFQELQNSGKTSMNGFVAMSFSVDRLPIWEEVIKPAISAAGYKPIRVDKYEHSNRIDDEIIAQIRRCRFLVADFTEQKPGIYFEAGLALGLGRRVIWMCDEADKERLHFDIRQFNNILYSDKQDARKRLENRIVALEGQGELKS